MITPTDLKNHVKNFLGGLVDSLGEISPAARFVALPHKRAGVYLARQGYTATVVDGPAALRRTHAIEDCLSLADWLKRHAKGIEERTEILVDDGQVVAALDPRNPDGCIVVAPLDLHPRWKRWAECLERQTSQAALLKLVRGALEDFGPPANADSVSAGELLAMQLAKFSAVRNSDVQVDMDDRGFVTFAAMSEKTEVRGKIPPRFTITVPMFLDVRDGADIERTYTIELLLGVEPAIGKGPPTFTLSCPQLDVIRRRARLDVVAHLKRLLGEAGFLVGLGTYETQKYTAKITE